MPACMAFTGKTPHCIPAVIMHTPGAAMCQTLCLNRTTLAPPRGAHWTGRHTLLLKLLSLCR